MAELDGKSSIMEEVWKIIPEYPEYEISNFGRVRHNGKILKGHVNNHGYVMVKLGGRGGKDFQVHRLVALAFIPNDDLFKNQVNHKDECKINNFVWVNKDGTIDTEKSNLEWCDNRYNSTYGTAIKRMMVSRGENNYGSPKPVFHITDNGIVLYNSINEASVKASKHHSTIKSCCETGNQWEYADFGLLFLYLKKKVLSLWPVSH